MYVLLLLQHFLSAHNNTHLEGPDPKNLSLHFMPRRCQF